MSKAPFISAACLAVFVALSPSVLADDAPAAQPQAQPALPPTLQPEPPTGANDPAPGSLDEVLCEIRDNAITGTRIAHKRKICHTRREWMDQAEMAQNTLQDIQEDGRKQSGVDFGKKGGRSN